MEREALIKIERAAEQVQTARALSGVGRDAEAIALLWDALPVLERRLGEYHPEVADALEALAEIHVRRGEHDEAAMLLERVQLVRDSPLLQPS